MRFRSLAFLLSIAVLLASSGFAQTATQTAQTEAALERAKKRKELDESMVAILDQTIAGANELRLPNNRAVVLAISADLYWRFDSKRSRDLYRSAAAEIVTYNDEVDKERRESTEVGIIEPFDQNDPRADILNLIANRDADLALELLVPTRSTSLMDAMAKVAIADMKAGGGVAGTGTGTVGAGIGGGPPQPVDPVLSMQRSRVSQGIAMGENFKMRAAFSDPERAIKALKDSLAKGISTNVISYLQVIYRSDEKKALDLSGEVVSKIVGADLVKNNNELNGTINFLQFVSRPVPVPPLGSTTPRVKQFSFSETQVRDIANKLATTFLQPGTTPALTSALTRSLPYFEKVLPEKLVQLKQRDAQNKKAQSTPAAGNPQSTARLNVDANTTPEDILAQAAKMTNERDKLQAYQVASSRIGQITTDDARAKKLIDQIPDANIRANALKQFESARITRLTASDKFEEARGAISALTDRKVKVQKLVALAGQFQRKGGELNVENAKGLMTEAKMLTNPFPEDEDELGDLMEVVRGYALVESDVAFRLIEPMIDEFNAMIQASSVLSKYNKRDRSFKKGEMVMRVNGSGALLPFRYVQHIQLLGSVDVERMSAMIDRFQRSDARTIMKLYVLQGYSRNLAQMPPRPVM